MSIPMIIGIAGAKRVGKDTLAKQITEHLGYRHDSFAGPIREFVCGLLQIRPCDYDKKKEMPISWLDGITPRQMMQTLGTEWGRNMVHPELWLRSLKRRYTGSGIVISDVRFSNEAEVIINLGGVVIEVTRPGVYYTLEHESEKQIPRSLIHATIANIGNPHELLNAALRVFD